MFKDIAVYPARSRIYVIRNTKPRMHCREYRYTERRAQLVMRLLGNSQEYTRYLIPGMYWNGVAGFGYLKWID